MQQQSFTMLYSVICGYYQRDTMLARVIATATCLSSFKCQYLENGSRYRQRYY